MQGWINGLFDVLVGEAYKVLFYDIYGFPLIVLTLLIGSITFTLYFRFINIRAFKHSIEVIKGKYDNPNDKGQISHFQALTSALSGTIGLGNIAGVAIAVTVGGPGAVFWMMFIAVFSMSAKFVSGTLSQMYRKINSDGSIDGGPMYYLDMGLKETGRPKLGRFLGIVYAIFIIGGALGGGNMFQSNQSFALVSNQLPFLNGFGWLYGLILAVLVGAVIIGGIKRIGRATEKIVPLMVVIYVLASLFIIFTNIDRLPSVISLIFSEAFNASAIYGGLIGSIVQGIRRAVFSNEGGVGSASIAHSAAKTDEPVREGIVAMIGPFIDTIVICFMTACVILITKEENKDYQVYQNDLKHNLITNQISELNEKKKLVKSEEQVMFIDYNVQEKTDSLRQVKKDLFLLGFAYAEPYIDVNFNNKWDDAEPFTDSNDNGKYDDAEYLEDCNANGYWNEGEYFEDSNDNGKWDDAEPFTDSNDNGKYDDAEPFEDLRGNLRWDDAEPFEDLNDNGKRDLAEYWEDDNFNGKWDDAEPFTDLNNNSFDDAEYFEDWNGNGKWDVGEYFEDDNRNGKWDDAESFTDLNQNRQWDDGEYFEDWNGNGKWDVGEYFEDWNGNGKWDDAEPFEDLRGNLRWDNAEYFEDWNGNGKWDVVEYFEDDNRNGKWDDAESFTDLNENGEYDDAEAFEDSNYNGKWDGAESFTDSNENGKYDDAEAFEDLGNGLYDKGEHFDDCNGNLSFDKGEYFKDIGNGIRDENEFFLDRPNKQWDKETDKAEGAILTSSAFGSVISWFPAILTIVVFLFSYSTMISWYYYGDKSWTYLFGRKSIRVFQGIYLGCVVLGAIASLGSIIDFSDMMLLSAAFPNIIGAMFLLPKLKVALNEYWKKYQNKEFKAYETSFIKDLVTFKKKDN